MVENWIEDDKDLSGRYTRARKTRALMIFDEMLEIQDSKPDSVINLGSDGESGSQRIDPAFVTWQANRVSLRKWVLARMEPGLFGDRLDLNHSGSIESPRPLDPLLAEAAAKRAEENGEV